MRPDTLVKQTAMDSKKELPVKIFSTGRQSVDGPQDTYLERVVEAAKWSEAAGCTGMLVYTDNGIVDAWLVAQIVIENTQTLCPLVATQPVYMHPYSVAKMVTSFAYLYKRKIYLNMVAGGFKTDLLALCDDTPHDMRYERIREYTAIIKELLNGSSAVTFSGTFYRVENLRLKPPLPPDLFPGIFLSCSSDAGMKTAMALGTTAMEYPNPAEEYASGSRNNSGIRVVIITAQTEENT